MPTDASMPGGGAVSGQPEVPYQSLYRRFRPQRFSEVRGQEHVTAALRNAVRDDRVAHAYLFSGPRGTGKTSTARILAKALNCESPEEGEPCGGCESCRSIALGSSFDVHELDAASSNGVDAMRDLVARAALSSPGRWKVYIVDEVHMLSTAASNALLKTLEEPPEHVVFVLATTDPQKVLPTVRSRTQHYEFHLLDEEVLSSLLADVASAAELALPEGALGSALRRGRGSARDALSALDQVAAAGVLDDDLDALRAVVAAVAARDLAQAIGAVDAAVRQGREPQQLAVELIERLRTGFLALVAPAVAHGAPAEAADEARELGTARCVRAMEVLGAAVVAMREAPEPRVTLEMAVVRLASPEADDSPAALAERLERLERRLADLTSPSRQGNSGPPPPPAPPPPTQPPRASAAGGAPSPAPGRPALGAYRRRASGEPAGPALAAEPPPPPAPPQPLAPPAAGPRPSHLGAQQRAGEPPTRDELVTAWGDHVLGRLRPKVRAVYQVGRFLESEAGEAVLAVPNAAHLAHAEPLREEVASALASHFGRPVALRVVVDGAETTSPVASAPLPPSARRVASPEPPVSEPPTGDEPESLDDLFEDDSPGEPALPGISWAEESLLRAFPGAEEVAP